MYRFECPATFLSMVFSMVFVMASFAGADLLVANKSEATLSRIDATTGSVAAVYATDSGPHEVVVHPDRPFAVVSNYGSDSDPGHTLTVVDFDTSTVRTIDLAPESRPHGMAWLSDGKRLAVTTEGRNTVTIVDVESGYLDRVIPVGGEQPHMIVLDASDQFAWVTLIECGCVAKIELETGKVAFLEKSGDGSEGIALSADDETLWVTHRGEGRVSAYAADTLTEKARIDVEGMAIRVELDPSGEVAIVVSATGGTITKIDARSFEKVGELDVAGDWAFATGRFMGGLFGFMPVPVGVQFDPSGEIIYVANSFGGVIVVVDAKTFEIKASLRAGAEPDGMDWLEMRDESR